MRWNDTTKQFEPEPPAAAPLMPTPEDTARAARRAIRERSRWDDEAKRWSDAPPEPPAPRMTGPKPYGDD